MHGLGHAGRQSVRRLGLADAGNVVELALDRPDLGSELRAFLVDLVQRRKL